MRSFGTVLRTSSFVPFVLPWSILYRMGQEAGKADGPVKLVCSYVCTSQQAKQITSFNLA